MSPSEEPAPGTRHGGGGPGPTDEELAAIVAAVEVAWPRPTVASSAQEPPPRWRFAGRWWSKPVPVRRGRP
jgi:hypothetical protein